MGQSCTLPSGAGTGGVPVGVQCALSMPTLISGLFQLAIMSLETAHSCQSDLSALGNIKKRQLIAGM